MPYRGDSYINDYKHGDPAYSHSYHCGHCNKDVVGHVAASYNTNEGIIKWLLCTGCGNGSVITKEGILFPTSKFGSDVEGLPETVRKAYDEARNCFSIGAHTSCELMCRKILMNVCVDKGAKENDKFVNYLDFLKSSGYITDAMMDWVKLIRDHGGESTHYIDEPDKTRAESTLVFTEQMLKIIYDVTAKAAKYAPPKSP